MEATPADAEQPDDHGDDERPETPQAVDPGHEISVRLAAYRTQRGLKVSALAKQVGVSPSLISQIERGQSRPSVTTLFALAEALDVPVDAFFRDAAPPANVRGITERPAASAPAPSGPTPGRYVVRRGDRSVIDIHGGVRWERLTASALDEVEFLELVYEPHAESHAALYRHPGMEMVLVLTGTMVIFVGFERYELGPGDSICFPSTQPHRYLNPTDETTRAVSVILFDGGRHGPPSAPPTS